MIRIPKSVIAWGGGIVFGFLLLYSGQLGVNFLSVVSGFLIFVLLFLFPHSLLHVPFPKNLLLLSPPVLWVIGTVLLLISVPGVVLQLLVSLLGAAGFVFLTLELGKGWGTVLSIPIFFFLAAYGIHVGLFGITVFFEPSAIMILLVFFVLQLLLWLSILRQHEFAFSRLLTLSLLFAFLMTEFAWSIFFLPYHFFTAGFLLTSLLYLCWHLFSWGVAGALTRKRFLYLVGVVGILMLAVILTSPINPFR